MMHHSLLFIEGARVKRSRHSWPGHLNGVRPCSAKKKSFRCGEDQDDKAECRSSAREVKQSERWPERERVTTNLDMQATQPTPIPTKLVAIGSRHQIEFSLVARVTLSNVFSLIGCHRYRLTRHSSGAVPIVCATMMSLPLGHAVSTVIEPNWHIRPSLPAASDADGGNRKIE